MTRPRFFVLSLFLSFAPALYAANPRVLAYYYYWDKANTIPYNASTIPYKQLTDIVHANISPNPQGDGTVGVPTNFLEPELITRAHKAGVKVLVSVAGPPYLFAKINASSALRATFAQNLARFVQTNGYDGLDFDYEVPYDQTEATNFTLMVAALRADLPAGQFLISAATTSNPGSWGVYDFPGLIPLLDFFNVMTYDFHGPWTDHSGHNSPLYLSPLDPGQEGSLKTSVDLYLSQFGVPAANINLGTAFYGYGFDVNGLWYSCGCEQTQSFTYTQIQQLLVGGGWTEKVDPLASAPYATNPNTAHIGFLTYDTPSSTAKKVNYALKTRGLGGVFMWEISQDYNGKTQPLMTAMHNAATQKNVLTIHTELQNPPRVRFPEQQ
ncbi:MAG TPA: glycoside hydrolase family 18 protein [Candidatus Solibacter sp.]|nr:glycoside hydrolase family 18 protein [Candidatus Solibacter sp.]